MSILSIDLKNLAGLAIGLPLLVAIAGCGSGGNGDDDSYRIGVVTDSNSQLTLFAWAPSSGEALGILGNKDAAGLPTKMTGAVVVNGAGEGATVMLGEDGLPELVAYSDGIQMQLVEFGSSYIDALIIPPGGEEFSARIDVDPTELAEMMNLAKQVSAGKADSFNDPTTIFKYGGWVVSIGACALSVSSAVVSHGVATPLAVKWCGSLAVKIAAAAADKYLSKGTSATVGTIQCAAAVVQGPLGALEASECLSAAVDIASLAKDTNDCPQGGCNSQDCGLDGAQLHQKKISCQNDCPMVTQDYENAMQCRCKCEQDFFQELDAIGCRDEFCNDPTFGPACMTIYCK